jgi:hypothetical protein
MLGGEVHIGEDVALSFVHEAGESRELRPELIGGPAPLCLGGLGAGLSEAGRHEGRDGAPSGAPFSYRLFAERCKLLQAAFGRTWRKAIMPNINEGFADKSIKVFGGLAWTRYLSCDPDRSKIGVNLADRDTDPNQKWYYYVDFARNISQIANGFNDRYLTRYKDDTRRVTLDINPPASPDLRTWGFIPLGNNTFNIYGVTNGTMYFLSCQENGFVVDMFDHDDGSGRQRWVIDLGV